MSSVLRGLRRFREWLVLTNLGVVILAAGLVAYFFFGLPRADYAVQIVAAVAIALVAGAFLVVVVGALLTHLALKREPVEAPPLYFEAVSGFATALAMPARRWFPLLEVEWVWETPEAMTVTSARVEGTILENVESPARTHAKQIRRRFVIEDGFGLARIVLRREEAREVTVVPWVGALSRSPLLRSLASGDDRPHPRGALEGDRVDMRRYVPGDPLRLALWKVYARTRVLMVRTPERAIAPAVRVAAYLVAARGDEAPAAAARVAVEGGLLGERWVFGADGGERLASTREEALAQIVDSRRYSNDAELGQGGGLTHFLAAASEDEPARAVLFVPAVGGAWVDTVSAAIARHPAHTSVVLVADGVIDEPTKTPVAERVLRVPEDPDPSEENVANAAEIGSIAKRLARAGAEVGAVNRVTGRTIPLGLGQAMERHVA